MKKYTEMNHDELLALKKELDKEFEEIKAQGLALDMSRGKPSNAQLDLSMEMMDVLKGDSNLLVYPVHFSMLKWLLSSVLTDFHYFPMSSPKSHICHNRLVTGFGTAPV